MFVNLWRTVRDRENEAMIVRIMEMMGADMGMTALMGTRWGPHIHTGDADVAGTTPPPAPAPRSAP